MTRVAFYIIFIFLLSCNSIQHNPHPCLNIVATGNSLTIGTEQNNGGRNYTDWLKTYSYFNSCDVIINKGVNSQTTSQMISSIDGQLIKLIDTSKININIAWEITNDLFKGSSKETAISNFLNYCTRSKKAGFKVIVATGLKRNVRQNGKDDVQFEADISWCNSQLITHPQFYDAIIDVRQIPELSDNTNLVYFTPDQIHLTQEGYRIFATAVLEKVSGISGN